MRYTGNIHKMNTELTSPVVYKLRLNEDEISVNTLLNKHIKLTWTGKINCIKCGRPTNSSFLQGFCYNCFLNAPEAAPCILNPELCQAHNGTARDMDWSKENCLANHYVYLALSSGIKVGVARASQIPTRWIDQGAVRAVKFALTPNRHLAGLIEVDLKQYFSDKTVYQKMLKNDIDLQSDILAKKNEAFELLKSDLKQYCVEDNSVTEIEYPVLQYPKRIVPQSFDKNKVVEGILTGIKGQYLIFENGNVLNIRKFGGYKINLDF